MHHLHHLLDVNRAFSSTDAAPPTTARWHCTPCTRWAPIPASCSSSSHTGRPTMPCRGEQQQGMRRSCSLSGCVSSWQHGWPTRGGCPPLPACWSRVFHHWRRLPSADPLRLRAGKWPSGRAGRRIGRLAVQTLAGAGTGQRAPVQDIGTLLSALAQQWEGACWQGEWITKRLRQVTDAPTWASGLPSGVSSSDLLVQLANAALALYWQTGNFTVLHMVTGSRAAAIVASYLPAPWLARWQTLMWQAVALPMSRSARRHCRRRSGPIPASCRGKTCWPGQWRASTIM